MGAGGPRQGATAAVQAGSEGGRREVDGFKKTLGTQTGSLADGLDAASGRRGVGWGGAAAGSQCFWLTQSSWASAQDTELATTQFLLWGRIQPGEAQE